MSQDIMSSAQFCFCHYEMNILMTVALVWWVGGEWGVEKVSGCIRVLTLPEMAYGAVDIHMFVLYKPL